MKCAARRRITCRARTSQQLRGAVAEPEHQRTTIMPTESRIRYGIVTDPSQAADPPPRRGDPLPRRGDPLPQRGDPLPRRGDPLPQRGDPLPQRGDPLPQRGDPLPRRGDPLPQRGDPLPQRGDPLPQRGDPLPQRGDPLPQRGEPLPQRGEPAQDPGALPRRTGRTRRSGRHRSTHRLSLPSDAPTLLLAVPGSATAAHGPWPALAVLVPLLAGPHPRADAALRRAVAGAAGEVIVAEHLGPHPLLAEALHARLAQVGLARESRVRGLSISNAANGVLVLADRGEDAVRAAGVAAVLLAGRLAAPAMHASIDES